MPCTRDSAHIGSTPALVNLKRISKVSEFKSNAEYIEQADTALSGHRGEAALLILAYLFIHIFVQIAGQLTLGLVSILCLGAFEFSYAAIGLDWSRKGEAELGQLFVGFREKYVENLLGGFVISLCVLLGLLLLVVPGIILAYRWAMVFRLMADGRANTAMEAMRLSRQIMAGSKWRYFCLQFRFVGWLLLMPFTFFLGYFWLIPRYHTACTKFYEELVAIRLGPKQTPATPEGPREVLAGL
jgi:uncharacterized membrane protein